MTSTTLPRITEPGSHLADPVMMHFSGAPPMAMLTVGARTLLLGRDLIGPDMAVRADWLLWGGGTIAGLCVAVAVPTGCSPDPRRATPSAAG